MSSLIMDMSDHHQQGGASLWGDPAATILQDVALASYNTPLPPGTSLPSNKPDHHEAPQSSPSITRSGTPSTLFDRDPVHSLHGSPRSSISSFPGHAGLPGLPMNPQNREVTRSPAIRAQSPLLKRSKTPLRSHRPQSPIGIYRPQSPLSGRPQPPLNSRTLNSIANAIRPPPPHNLRQVESGDLAEKQRLLQYLLQQAATANREVQSSNQPEDTLRSLEEDHCINMHSPDSQDSTMSATTPKHVNDMVDDPIADEPSPQSTNSDRDCFDRDLRVLKRILEAEFDIYLGEAQPPEDILEAVSVCLQQITLSLDGHRSSGVLVPFTVISASGGNSSTSASTPAGASDHSSPSISTSKRRTVSNEDEDGGDSNHSGEGRDEDDRQGSPWPQGQGSQKKPKTDQSYPCPFRKRDPLVFNYHRFGRCVKGPFPNMPELK